MTNAELEAMCEQAFPLRFAECFECFGRGYQFQCAPEKDCDFCGGTGESDVNADYRSKALALAIEVRDKTREADCLTLCEYCRHRERYKPAKLGPYINGEHFPTLWYHGIYVADKPDTFICQATALRSLLSEA